MAVKVIVPNKFYNAVFMGVEFKEGVGIFEDEKAAKEVATMLGYKIEKIDEPKAEEKPEPKKAPKKKATKKVEE